MHEATHSTCNRGWLLAILMDSCRRKLNFCSCSVSFTMKAEGDKKQPAFALWRRERGREVREDEEEEWQGSCILEGYLRIIL